MTLAQSGYLFRSPVQCCCVSVDSLNGMELWQNTVHTQLQKHSFLSCQLIYCRLCLCIYLSLCGSFYSPFYSHLSSSSFSIPISLNGWGSLLSFCCGFIDKTDMCNTKMIVVFLYFARPNLLCDDVAAVAVSVVLPPPHRCSFYLNLEIFCNENKRIKLAKLKSN